MKPTKHTLTFWERTYRKYDYWHTSIHVYSSHDPIVHSIDTLISECVTPNYQTQEICDRVRAKYERMRDNRVTHVMGSALFVSRVAIEWLHFNQSEKTDRYCRPNIKLREAPREIESDFRLYSRISAALKRADRYTAWESPASVRAYLGRAKALELTFYRGEGSDLSELVLMTPTAAAIDPSGMADIQLTSEHCS